MTCFQEWRPEQPLPDARRAVALGVFDGLHLGHRAVISAACGIRDTQQLFLTACVLSLAGVPKSGGRLTDERQERDQCETLGVDEWLTVPFAAICELSPEAFVQEILHQKLNARVLCCGYNYRFGKNGAGTADTLRTLCEPLGIRVIAVPPVEREGEAVSATRIRQALELGDMQRASQLLGRPFTVELPVSHGNRLGHTLGFPTVNQVFPNDAAVPRHGVYASLVVIDGRMHMAVTNVGLHPTVGGAARPQAETWIADFEGDLYGQVPRVELIRFLRPEQRFSSTEELKRRIDADRREAIACLSGADGGKAILFDFDETLQDRPAAFLKTAVEMLRHHCPGLSAEEHERRARVMLEENQGGYVDYPAYFRDMYARWDWQGADHSEALFDEYVRCFPTHSVLFPDAADTLRELRRRGYRIGLVTNGVRLVQNRKLDMVGIRPLLDTVAVAGDEGVSKPHSELFRRAAARLCVAPENCIMVGDHLEKDIEGALGAGMQAIYLNAFGAPHTTLPVPEITSPGALTAALRSADEHEGQPCPPSGDEC